MVNSFESFTGTRPEHISIPSPKEILYGCLTNREEMMGFHAGRDHLAICDDDCARRRSHSKRLK